MRMKIDDALRDASRTLDQAGVENARADARLMLRFILKISLSDLLARGDDTLDADQKKQFEALVEKRAARRPMAQVIGMREFWGLDFKVTEHTLDPRPDSETIIEMLFKYQPVRSKPLTIVDFGTGTGCLLLAALSEYPAARGVGVDISDAALTVAEGNAVALRLKNRAIFKKSDWNSQINGVWDVVISNPPYIKTEEIPGLSPEVAKFEPRLALDGGGDGLQCYRAITRFLPKVLADGGVALLEVGAGQAASVADLAKEQGLRIEEIAHDLAGIERCVVIRK